jgi:hypothetical protein
MKQHKDHVKMYAQVILEAKIEIISIKIIKVVVEIAADVIPCDNMIAS